MKSIKAYIFSAVLLAGMSGAGMAEDWQFILEFDSAPDDLKQYLQRIARLYVDTDSIIEDKGHTLVWKKLVFKEPITGRYGKHYKFTTERWAIDCKDRKMALIENALYGEDDERIGHKVINDELLQYINPVAGSRQALGMLYTCREARKAETQEAAAQTDNHVADAPASDTPVSDGLDRDTQAVSE